jgi:hypothetical protein
VTRSKSSWAPSPALLVSVIALVLALAGSAIALPGKGSVDKNDLAKGAVTKKAIKKGAVTAKAIKANAVTTPAIADGSVTTGKIADGAVTEAKVLDAVLPRAFAYVNASQEIVAENSSGVGSATATLDDSFVCFSGLPFTPKNVQVTPARGGGSLEVRGVNVFQPGDNTFCDGAEQASVQFFVSDTGAVDNAPPGFYVTFFD